MNEARSRDRANFHRWGTGGGLDMLVYDMGCLVVRASPRVRLRDVALRKIPDLRYIYLSWISLALGHNHLR